MSGATVVAIVLPALVVLAGLLLAATARRRETEGAVGHLNRESRTADRGDALVGAPAPTEPRTGRDLEKRAVADRAQPSTDLQPLDDAAPIPYVPPDDETVAVTRRQFFNRGILTLVGVSLAAWGGSVLAFIWPQVASGFGSKIRVGPVSDIKTRIRENNGFLYVPEGRMWVTEYPAGSLDKARAAYSPGELAGMEQGLVALFQTCPHLGCRVPSCETSQWFECPCHGSRYNRVGEKRAGPAPRGMDRFAMEVSGGVFSVDTGTRIQGPTIGTNTTGQEPEGPSCLGGGTHE